MQQPFNDCASRDVADALNSSPTNLSVADITSASSSKGSVGALTDVDIPWNVVNNDIVALLGELSLERPCVTTTMSGRVSKPVQKYNLSRL